MKSIKIDKHWKFNFYNSIQNKVISLIDIEIVIEDGKIIEIGKNLNPSDGIIDCEFNIVTPGFVDPHTHPVFVNSRNNEFLEELQENLMKIFLQMVVELLIVFKN